MNTTHTLIMHKQIWSFYTSYFIMESNGHAMIRVLQEDDEIELTDFYVEEAYRGQGLGQYMLDHAIELSKSLTKHGTISITTNYNSEPFCDEWYQRTGFKFACYETPLSLKDSDELEWMKVYKMTF